MRLFVMLLLVALGEGEVAVICWTPDMHTIVSSCTAGHVEGLWQLQRQSSQQPGTDLPACRSFRRPSIAQKRANMKFRWCSGCAETHLGGSN